MVSCGVPQGSVLCSKNATNILNPIVLDDTNLFFTHQNIRYLFPIVSQELEDINEWCISNKLSLNIKKIKYSFFQKPSQIEDIPIFLRKVTINNYEIQRTE